MSSYHPRPVTQYGVQTLNGWPTKIYGLAVEGEPGQELLDAAKSIASAVLPPVSAALSSPSDQRAAFLVAHRERAAWIRHMLADEPDLEAYLAAGPPAHGLDRATLCTGKAHTRQLNAQPVHRAGFAGKRWPRYRKASTESGSLGTRLLLVGRLCRNRWCGFYLGVNAPRRKLR